jgi:hypothetical protein
MLGVSLQAGTPQFVGWLDEQTLYAIRTYTVFPVLAAVLCLPILPTMERAMNHRLRLQRTVHLGSTLLLTAGVALSILMLVADSYNPFLYFRF